MLFTIFNCDAPKAWGLYFQDSASPQMEALVELHNIIMFYLIIILFAVGWILFSIIKNFIHTKWLISNKYLNHGTMIELIWTITPALILILIAFPSFKLLYLVDEVPDANISMSVEGFIYCGLTLYILNKIKDARFSGEKINTLKGLTHIPYLNTSKSLCYNLLTINKLVNNKKCFHTKVKASNRIGPHNIDVLSVIIGSLLGDGYANARTIEGVRFCYRQSIIHEEYLMWLYEFFYSKGYTSNLKPRKYKRFIKNNSKEYFGYEFNTFTFRSLHWIHKLFYKKGKKYINPKIEQYLTPLALAIWIMDDGCWTNNGIRIATNSFDYNENKILISILYKLYNLDCTIQTIDGRHSIYIKKNSIDILKKIVEPYIIPSMKYKIGI